ncbi:MAG: sensor histidine kinase [Chloroflexota bacterium]
MPPTTHPLKPRSTWLRFWRQSLRVHVLIALGSIVALATIMVGLGIGFFVYRSDQTNWQNRQREAARYAALAVNEFVGRVQVSMTNVGLLDTAYLEQSPSLLFTLLRQNPALLEIIRLDYQGQVLAGAYQDDAPVLSNLFTIPQSTWFVTARRGQTYAGQVQISANQKPYLILAQPAADHGVVAARLSLEALWRLVDGLRFGETGQVYVVDSRGSLIAAEDQELVLGHTSLDGRAELQAASAQRDHRWTGEYVNFQGRQVLGSTQLIEPVQWTVFAETQLTETLAATRRALLLLVGIALIFSLALLLATNSAMRSILFNPLAQLRDGAVRIGQGDLEHRVSSGWNNELGQLATAFDEMSANLKEREAALAQARDAAQSASQFKSRLLANVSHDLRTPLSAIMGYADILKEEVYGELNERQRNSVQRILANTQRLLELVNSLLDQAQIEAGRLDWEIAPFKPADLMTELQNVMGVLAQQKGLQLITYIDPGLPVIVHGDQRRVYQIATNLVGNAIKFTDRGWVRVAMLPDSSYWIIRVSDTGRGIPPEALKHIFDPFNLVDNSTTRSERGVGLGLSIVQQLAGLMGGCVDVTSELGHGSTFSVHLPVEHIRAVEEHT